MTQEKDGIKSIVNRGILGKRGVVKFNFEEKLNSPKSGRAIVNESKSRKKKIVHTFFYKFTPEDKFWADFFEKCSKNIFPDGFSFAENVIYYSGKNKEIYKLEVSENTPMELVQDFFHFYGQIFSPLDQSKKKKNNGRVSVKSWGKISTANKIIYIEKYINSLDLTKNEKVKTIRELIMGIMTGKIKSKHVIFDESLGEIKDITCFDFDSLEVVEAFKSRKISKDSVLEKNPASIPNFGKTYTKKLKASIGLKTKEKSGDRSEDFSTFVSTSRR